MKKVVGLLLFGIYFAMAGCGGGGSGSSSTPIPQEVNFYPDAKIVNAGSTVTPDKQTIILDDDSNLQLDESNVAPNSLTFTSSDGTPPTIQVGQILAGMQGETGFLRKVVAVNVVGNSVTVTTQPATMAEAFEDADISISIPLLDYATDTTPAGTDLTPINALSKTITHTIHGEFAYKPNDYASASGSVLIYDVFDFNFDGSIRGNKFTSMNLSNKVLIKNEFNVAINVPAAMAVNPEKSFTPIYDKTFVALIGGVPVPVKVKVTPILGINMDFKGNFSTSTSYVYKNLVTTGLQYDGSSFSLVGPERKAEKTVPEPVYSYSGNASAKGYVNAKVSIAFYEWAGGPGLGLNLGPYSEMTASVVSASQNVPTTCQSTFNLGLDGNLEADLGAFDGAFSAEQKTWNLFNLAFNPPIWSDNACPFNIDPTIDAFSAVPASGNPPLEVTFNYAVSDANSDQLICSFDYDGDGLDDDNVDCTTGSGSRTHTYADPGEYRATLNVTDTEGGEMTETAVISVIPGPLPPTVVTFTATPSQGTPPLDVTFNYAVNDVNVDDVLTCDFDFDGDTTSDQTINNCTSGTLNHTYSTVGNYQPRLTVNDGYNSAIMSSEVVVSSATNTPPEVVSFTVSPNPGTVPFDTTINYQVSDADGDPLTCTIAVTFGEYTSTTPIAECSSGSVNGTIENAGSYQMKITVDDGANQGTASTTLTANMATTGSIRGYVVDSDSLGIAGVNVSLRSEGTELAATQTDMFGEYTFANIAPATYSLVMTKSGFSGATVDNISVTAGTSVTVNKTLTAPPPTSSDTVSVYSGQANFTTDPGTADEIVWNLTVVTSMNLGPFDDGPPGGAPMTVYGTANGVEVSGSAGGIWGNKGPSDATFEAYGTIGPTFGAPEEQIDFIFYSSYAGLAQETLTGTINAFGMDIHTFTSNRVP